MKTDCTYVSFLLSRIVCKIAHHLIFEDAVASNKIAKQTIQQDGRFGENAQ